MPRAPGWCRRFSATAPRPSPRGRQSSKIPAMWATVVVLALVAATDPLRLGWAVVLISQPRPIRICSRSGSVA
jgi:hypothetical protein